MNLLGIERESDVRGGRERRWLNWNHMCGFKLKRSVCMVLFLALRKRKGLGR
jgi:hypothetical protein